MTYADSDVVSELTSDAFALKGESGETSGVAYVVESYGINYQYNFVRRSGLQR